MNKRKHDKEMIELLKGLFGAEREGYRPDEAELRLMEERGRLEEEMLWSFENYVNHYDRIKAYGLDLKLLKHLEWFIIYKLENDRETFLESPFYRQFKGHEVVKGAFLEYERVQN